LSLGFIAKADTIVSVVISGKISGTDTAKTINYDATALYAGAQTSVGRIAANVPGSQLQWNDWSGGGNLTETIVINGHSFSATSASPANPNANAL
jgi:hypothetical protein